MSRSSSLLNHAGIAHAFGTIAEGDLRSAPLPDGLASARQVHGNAVVEALTPGRSAIEADGLMARSGLRVGVFTADCVPILLADPRAGLVAAVHSGWRGTLSGIIKQAIKGLLERGADLEELRVAIGPCIGPCCYQVREDLLSVFQREFGPRVRQNDSRLDLALAIKEHLTSIGIPPANVDHLNECTRCGQRDDMYVYFSHRRSGEAAGRQLSWVRAPGRFLDT